MEDGLRPDARRPSVTWGQLPRHERPALPSHERSRRVIDDDGVSEISRMSTSTNLTGRRISEVSRLSTSTNVTGRPISELSSASSDSSDSGPENLDPGHLRPGTSGQDAIYHGSNAGDRDIPLMEMSPYEAAFRKNSEAPTKKDGIDDGPCNWLPTTLRWPFMLFLVVVTLSLGAIALGLASFSRKHQGFGTGENSPVSLSVCRLIPTLLAVIYTLFLISLVNDIKRTEVFARLSKYAPASASSTLFYRPSVIWLNPFEALNKHENNGARSWALFWASAANIFAFIIICPFSAALLAPTQVLVERGTTFSRLAASIDGPMKLSTDDSILFRTISSVLLNTSTSAWLDNEYAVLPFWPADQDSVPFGAVLSGAAHEWTATTTVYQAGMDCQPMEIKSFSNSSYVEALDPTTSTMGVVRDLVSFVLASADGCSLGYSSWPASVTSNTIWESGGGWWSRGPDFSYPWLWNPSNGTYEGLNSTNPILLNTTAQCGDRSMFFLATPYTANQPFQAQGYICRSDYFQADIPVTVSNTGSSSTVNFDHYDFNLKKSSMDSTSIDIPTLEASFTSQNWSTKFQPPDASSNLTQSTRAKIGGPLILVGAQNNFDLSSMINDPNITTQALQVKQRFLGESMQSVFRGIGQRGATSVPGQTSMMEERIMVSLPVGILLAAVLVVSAIMIVMVMIHTRIRNRPLNLFRDPATPTAVASMIASEPRTKLLFDGLDRATDEAMLRQLNGHLFSLRRGVLLTYEAKDVQAHQFSDFGSPQQNTKSTGWRPSFLRTWLLGSLLISLITTSIAMAVVFAIFRASGIRQSLPASSFDILLNGGLIALAPYSIIPTFLAVCIKLWWGALDGNLRRLQPYVSMASNTTQNPKSITMSYMSVPIGWVVLRAARYRHWFLVLTATGAVLAEIFIICMSTLWNQSPASHSLNGTATFNLELRTVPAIFSVPLPSSQGNETIINTQNAKAVLSTVYDNLWTGWLYSSVIEGIYNSTPSPWMKDDWAFVPVSLTSTSDFPDTKLLRATNLTLGSPNNITMNTQSLRGRLDCTPVDMSNTSAWLTTLDFTNKSAWNFANIPADLEVGYELKLGLSVNQSMSDNDIYFSFFATSSQVKCCGNETGGSPGEAVVAYWSPPADAENTGIIVKWITGHPFPTPFNESASPSPNPNDSGETKTHWVWKDIPKVTALNCKPIFEVANASLTVDSATGIAQDYSILSSPTPDPHAWSSNYIQHNVSHGVPCTSNPITGCGYEVTPGSFLYNVSVSYGYLFHDVLLGASSSGGSGSNSTGSTSVSENLADRTFNFRLPGLNADFMSYASLGLVQQDKYALLDPNTLANVSSTVFSMFFKNFVHGNVSTNAGAYINGSWGIQPRGSVIPSDLGPTFSSQPTDLLQDQFHPSTATSTTNTVITTRIEKLDMNLVATIICLCILGVLAIITCVLLFWSRSGASLDVLPREVDTLGSLIGFMYASDKLLAISKVKGGPTAGGVARMGWFASGGKPKWGVEIMETPEVADEEHAGPTGGPKLKERLMSIGSQSQGYVQMRSGEQRPWVRRGAINATD